MSGLLEPNMERATVLIGPMPFPIFQKTLYGGQIITWLRGYTARERPTLIIFLMMQNKAIFLSAYSRPRRPITERIQDGKLPSGKGLRNWGRFSLLPAITRSMGRPGLARR